MLSPTAPSVLPTNLYPHPQQPNILNNAEERMQKFAQIAAQYEISHNSAARLRQLEGYEIIFICDDSGSMATAIGENNGPFAVRLTRWDELKQTVSITVDLASVLDPDGVDIYFLNRPPAKNVRHSSELMPIFASRPTGSTPITRVLRQVMQEKRNEIQERKLLIIIATDGQPTDDFGTVDIKTLKHVLKHERKPIDRILITFCACTDDDESIAYLNKWDRIIPYIDVCDDYRTERAEIWKVQGNQFPFSFGDYVVKMLLGSIDPYFDNLDQKRASSTKQASKCNLL